MKLNRDSHQIGYLVYTIFIILETLFFFTMMIKIETIVFPSDFFKNKKKKRSRENPGNELENPTRVKGDGRCEMAIVQLATTRLEELLDLCYF